MYRSAFIFVLFVFAASAMTRRSADEEAQEQSKSERCANETGFNPEILDSSKHTMTQAEKDDPTTACYIACIWKIEHMMNEDGTLNSAGFIGESADASTVQLVNECTKDKAANDCETVSNAIACFRRSESMLDAKSKKSFLRV